MIKKTSIKDISERVKQSISDLLSYTDEICNELEESEKENQTFLPQQNLRMRLYKEAEDLFEKFPEGTTKPPLFGIPIGVKDIFLTDGFETGCGSKLPTELFAGDEASSVSKLKRAGAIVLGKTVTTEFAYADPGPTKNPHNSEHTPGGSSSGSAAAVALGLVPVALGTQTIGSIIRPACYCGVFGFKPSYDRISKDGVIPFSGSVDHVGVFSQNLDDAKTVSSILCNNWNNNYDAVSEKITIGIPAGEYIQNAGKDILKRFEDLYKILSGKGVKIKPVSIFDNFSEVKQQHWDICAAELAEVHKEWYAEYKNLYRKHISTLIETGKKVSRNSLEEALEGREIMRKRIHNILNEHQIDVIIAPSSVDFAPKGLESTGNSIMNLPWTYTGLPVINIPFGKNAENLPFGFQIVGRFMKDEQLFMFAEKIYSLLQT